MTNSAGPRAYNVSILKEGNRVKKLIVTLMTGLMLMGLTIPGAADYEPKTDYMELMIQAVMKGDTEAGTQAEQARNEKIEALGLAYDPVTFDDLLLLSRVIYRESGNQSLEGQMAVGNVVLNRVADPAFPDTVEGVLAQKNQFSTYKSGVLRKTEPSAKSIIAAKLVLDGGVVKETRGALFFDCTNNSWAARNKQLIATFGDHNFYG